MTIVSGPMVSERGDPSYPSTDDCRCIRRSPEASYAACSSSALRILETPTHAPPSYGFMNIGKPTWAAVASKSNGWLYRADVYAYRLLSNGFLYGTRTVSGTFRPSRIMAQ